MARFKLKWWLSLPDKKAYDRNYRDFVLVRAVVVLLPRGSHDETDGRRVLGAVQHTRVRCVKGLATNRPPTVETYSDMMHSGRTSKPSRRSFG